MTRKMMLVVIATASLSGCGVFNELDEHGHDRNTAMLQSKVSLADAIAIAEKETGGRATRAGADKEDDAFLIKVLIAQGNKMQRVFIDPQTGKIVKTSSDEDDD
jgi:uncharacterized membrane protein YkoI